jgi:hypothetical protein
LWTTSFCFGIGWLPHNRQGCKGYDSPALQGELSIKIKSETLANKDVGELLIQIIKDSFRRGHEFEVTQLNKGINEDHAYIVAASPEQKAKIQRYHISIDNGVVIPTVAARRLSAKEVAKKNCLVLIAKNLNLIQPSSDVARCIKELLGEKLVVDIYFSRAQGEMHNGTANVEVVRFGALEEVFMSYRPHGAWRTMEVLEELT